MVIYEVNLHVDLDIIPAWRAWMDGHMERMLEHDGFASAELARRADLDDGRAHFTVWYRLHDQAALDAYLDTHAAAMRAEGERHFAGRFDADRRVLVRESGLEVQSVRPAYSTG